MPARIPVTILDTGILISGLGHVEGLPARVLFSVIGEGRALLSADLIAEYLSSLSGRRARRHHPLTPDEVRQFVRALQETAITIAAEPGPVCPDKRDQHLWDLLQTVTNSTLVTGEHALLESNHFPGRVLTPRQFVERYLDD